MANLGRNFLGSCNNDSIDGFRALLPGKLGIFGENRCCRFTNFNALGKFYGQVPLTD